MLFQSHGHDWAIICSSIYSHDLNKDMIHLFWHEGTYTVLIAVTHVIIIVAVASLVAGSISCLARLPRLTAEENWTFQSKRLKTHIFISAAFLAIGVLYCKGWADYPAFLFTSESATSTYDALSAAYTSFTGLEYSLVLAAYALPVSYLQARKVGQIVVATEGSTQVGVLKHDESLQYSFSDAAKLVFAVVGPFATGAITNVVSAIG